MKRIYLDYAASTPVAPEVFEVMKPYFTKKYGNPGSLHSFGQEAMAAVDKARETIAKAVGADFRQVIFTGSATEANNLALRGVVKAHKSNKTYRTNRTYRIIVSAIEHESILETARDLEKEGAEAIYLPVSQEGFVDLEGLKKNLTAETIIVSVMYANNEIGAIQPIKEIAEIIKAYRTNRSNKTNKTNKTNWSYPLFHTDAVQAFQFLDCDISNLGLDLMTLSAHKIYGPKGIGALIRPISPIGPIGPVSPILTGGGQEFGLRSGTENVAAIAGLAKAVELVIDLKEKEKKRVLELRDYFWNELKKIYPPAQINGGQLPITNNQLPNILNVYLPDQKASDLLVKFDLAGIAVSSGAACSVRSPKPSHVLQALGLPLERIKSSLRFSFGRFTTKEEIEEILKRIRNLIK